jgi:hypothetical protein
MKRALMVVAAIGMLVASATAKQGKGQGKGKGHDKHATKAAVVVFAPADRSFVTNYYRTNGLPPGLAKKSDLPPGLEKQLRRNGRLPPGLEKKLVPFPAAIEARLPPCPPDVHRGFMSGVAVMYNSRTGLVIDAMAVLGR